MTIPEGATHSDDGPGLTKWLRLTPCIHDYWCDAGKQWVTFQGGHNSISKDWNLLKTNNEGLNTNNGEG